MHSPQVSRRRFSIGTLGVVGASIASTPGSAVAAAPPGDLSPDSIYVRGNVLTMAESFDEARKGVVADAEAFAVLDGKIVAVGSNAEVLRLRGRSTIVVDLEGATVVPGFIDAHSHFPGSGTAKLYQANLSGPPVGPVTDIDSLVSELTKWAEGDSAGTWIRGQGYDQTLLKELRHPTRQDLDKVSSTKPIWISHANGHMGVANSKALEIGGVTADTPDPEGGFIARDPKTGEPTGLLQEPAAMAFVNKHLPAFTAEQITAAVEESVRQYAAAGVTTSIIAHGSPTDLRALQGWRDAGLLPLRMVMMQSSNPTPTEAGGVLEGFGDEYLSVGPYGESVHDGSIQGYTGYLTEPYHKLLDDAPYPDDWVGFPNQTREALTKRVSDLLAAGLRSAIHGNGDAAIDNVIHAYRTALEKTPSEDVRWRVEHAQMTRYDQLDSYVELGISPSFYVSHCFYWGDQHRDFFLGPERARRISPLRSAIERGIRFSIHLDTPVVPMDPLHAVWCAVNRTTRSGKVLGPEERISPHLALRAVTADAAWQNFLEDERGSLQPGTLADFVVLDADPLTVEPKTIKDIGVRQVIVGGEVVHEG